MRSPGVRTGTEASGFPGQCPLYSATQTVFLLRGSMGKELSGCGAVGRARDVPSSPSVCFLGCLHRGQATTSPRRPWPSKGCWKLEQSRTSLTSDLDRSCAHRSATLLPERPPAMAVRVPGAGMTSLDSPSPVWGGVPELARSEKRPCPWLLLWRPDLVRVDALGRWEPSEGTRLVVVTTPICQRREII